MPSSPLHAPVLEWYAGHARDLPWRAPGTTAWGVLVSEVMLQQTPVARVLPVYRDWLERWPTPGGAGRRPAGRGRAGRGAGSATRGGRCGCTRARDRDGRPARRRGARRRTTTCSPCPGVGDYTAAAVASFAFGGRHAVLDTNVRRVLARAVGGSEQPAPRLDRGGTGSADGAAARRARGRGRAGRSR